MGLSMHSNNHLAVSLMTMAHAAAACPHMYACDTHYPWQTEDVLTDRLAFREGCVDVSDAPGLGVDLDRDRLAALHERWLQDDGTLRDRDDAAAMRVAEPGWVAPSVPRW
jgi:glucarate dehydratase